LKDLPCFRNWGLPHHLRIARAAGLYDSDSYPDEGDSRRSDRRRPAARAQTGTGKTAAFGLPMIQRLTTQAPQRAA
jgi:hypothetical protein